MTALLEVRHLVKHFGAVRAVDDVSFTIGEGETFALVGESGCGKTTTGRCLLHLMKPTAGLILFEGQDVSAAARPGAALVQAARTDRLSGSVFVAQPALHRRPHHRRAVDHSPHVPAVGRSQTGRGAAGNGRSAAGLRPPLPARVQRRPAPARRHRPRLALNPRLIVADEPVSALDVSVQAQIVNLMMDLQKRLGVAYLFISHNLPVVRHIAHRTAVMYLGKIVESGPTADVFARPRHPYTQALLSAAPVADPNRPRGRILLTGEPPSPRQIPSGCRFHPRCPHAARAVQAAGAAVAVSGRRLRGGVLAAGTGKRRFTTKTGRNCPFITSFSRDPERSALRKRPLQVAAKRRPSSAWSGPCPRYRRWFPASGRA